MAVGFVLSLILAWIMRGRFGQAVGRFLIKSCGTMTKDDSLGARDMRNFLIPFFVLLAAFPAMSQSSPTLMKEQGAVVDAAQKAALQAVNFFQGDAEALKSA